jgi:uncharacterized protein
MNRLHLLIPLCLLLAAQAAAAAPIPRLEGPVNDYAHVISPEQQNRIREFLLDEEKKTSNQIVVLTVNSLDGEDIEGYSIKAAEAWRLGQKNKDNGVLLVAAIKDRKMRIEVGKGLEGVLTDALSSQIIRNEIAPKFKQGDYGGGLWAGVNAIDKAIRGEYKADPRTAANAGNVLLFMIIVIVFLVFYVRMSRYNQRRTGIPWWYSGGSGWGGSSWGGSSGGFSGGGGGYSGGGGDFGGGGASGGW